MNSLTAGQQAVIRPRQLTIVEINPDTCLLRDIEGGEYSVPTYMLMTVEKYMQYVIDNAPEPKERIIYIDRNTYPW